MEEKYDRVTTHRKLSLEAPIFVPKGSGVTSGSSLLHIGRQFVLTGTNVQEVSGCHKDLRDALVSSNVRKSNPLTPITQTNNYKIRKPLRKVKKRIF